jgi:hypothetical protein
MLGLESKSAFEEKIKKTFDELTKVQNDINTTRPLTANSIDMVALNKLKGFMLDRTRLIKQLKKYDSKANSFLRFTGGKTRNNRKKHNKTSKK